MAVARRGARGANRIPAGRAGLARKAVARQRRDYQMEGIRRACAIGCWIRQWIDDLQLLDDRAGPPVRDDERQRPVMFRAHVNEMDVEPVDLGHELRQGMQSRLHLAPIVVRRPVAREFPHRRQLHALGFIRDGLLFGPVHGRDAAA